MAKSKKSSVVEALRNLIPGFTYSVYGDSWNALKSIAVQAYELNNKDAPMRNQWFHTYSIKRIEVRTGVWVYRLDIACYTFMDHVEGKDIEWNKNRR